MPVIQVEPETFDAASAVFGRDMAGDIGNVWSALTGTLSSCYGMAGSDEAGRTWSQHYDPAAQDIAAVLCDLQNACLRIGSLLEQTGFNHGLAESASDPSRSVPTPADTTDYTALMSSGAVCVVGHEVMSAFGSSTSAPTGWGIVEDAVGYLWPSGDPSKLRSAASAWTTAAGGLEAVTILVPEATDLIATQKSPEVADALTVCKSMTGHLDQMAQSCRSLASACTQLANYIETAHHNIESELESFVEWTAGIEVVGGLLSVVTAGVAEAPTQGVEATRIAATAAKIAEFIRTLITAAEGLLDTIGTAVSKIGDVADNLKVILGARLSEVATTLAARLPLIGKDVEEVADTGLTSAAEIDTANDAAYSRYLARLDSEGRTPLDRTAWEKRYNTLRNNYARGNAYRDEVAADLGITPGEGGWQTEYTLPNSGRRFDIANPRTQQAIEVKSGSTPTADAMTQLSKDEGAIRRGWTIQWQLKQQLSPTLMSRLEALAEQYPGRFSYSVAGG